MSIILPHMVWPLVRIQNTDLKCAAHGSLEIQHAKTTQKIVIRDHHTTLSGWIFAIATKACIDNRKKIVSSNTSSTCPYNMANFGPLAAEIISLVWDTPANFNGFHVLAVLLHGTPVVGISQTLQRWTEAPPIFGRAAITLGIGSHSSLTFIYKMSNYVRNFVLLALYTHIWLLCQMDCT